MQTQKLSPKPTTQASLIKIVSNLPIDSNFTHNFAQSKIVFLFTKETAYENIKLCFSSFMKNYSLMARDWHQNKTCLFFHFTEFIYSQAHTKTLQSRKNNNKKNKNLKPHRHEYKTTLLWRIAMRSSYLHRNV